MAHHIYVIVSGIPYEVKEHDGYRFASESLYRAIENTADFEDIDNTIAYYFEEDVFESNTGEALYEIYDRHS